MDRVLITGGAGFLGSHLCERFLSEGYEVICMDNLITGSLYGKPQDVVTTGHVCHRGGGKDAYFLEFFPHHDLSEGRRS